MIRDSFLKLNRNVTKTPKLPYISKQLTVAIIVVMTLGMLPMLVLFVDNQEQEIIASNENAMTLVTQSVIENLQSIMVAGYADIAHDYSESLKSIAGIAHVAIARTDGSEAFLDNITIDNVNSITGDDSFYPRDKEDFFQSIQPNDSNLQAVLATQKMVKYYELVNNEERLTFLAPIINQERCQSCHGDDHEIRGLLKVSISQTAVKQVAKDFRFNTILIFIVSIIIITLAVLFSIYQTLINPINELNLTMRRVADGFLHLRAKVYGQDEISDIARNFNVMIQRIEGSNEAIGQERTKLLAILQTNQEGVICADISGKITLANPAAGLILGIDATALIDQNFDGCLGNGDAIKDWFADLTQESATRNMQFGKKTLSVAAHVLSNDSGVLVGRSLRFADITQDLEVKKRLETLSTIDPLTGLYNRHYFNVSIGHEISRSLIDNEPLNLLMLDIDLFKKVNDTHGHDVGDVVLVGVSKIVTELIRTNDVACRFGGEEFIILLPETPQSGARVLAERMRTEIQNTPINGVSITVSIGISDLSQTELRNPDELIRLADEQLYIAKDTGRNKVCYLEGKSDV